MMNGPFFPHGWGDLEVVQFKEDIEAITSWPPPEIKARRRTSCPCIRWGRGHASQVDWKTVRTGAYDGAAYRVLEASFKTPCVRRVFNALPPESRVATVQMLVPDGGRGGSSSGSVRMPRTSPEASSPPSCVLFLAATGDQVAPSSLLAATPEIRGTLLYARALTSLIPSLRCPSARAFLGG